MIQRKGLFGKEKNLQGILCMFLNDRPLRIQRQYLKCRAKRIEQDGKEQERTPLVKAIRRRFWIKNTQFSVMITSKPEQNPENTYVG